MTWKNNEDGMTALEKSCWNHQSSNCGAARLVIYYTAMSAPLYEGVLVGGIVAQSHGFPPYITINYKWGGALLQQKNLADLPQPRDQTCYYQ